MVEIDNETNKLLDEMGFTPSTKSPYLYETEIDNGVAYVDFRKVDGRRFAMIQNKPVDDEDTIPILVEFKKRRNEIEQKLLKNLGALQSSGGSILKNPTPTIPQPAPDTLERENIVSPQVSISPQPAPNGVQTSPSPTPNLYEFFLDLVGACGIVEFFGDTGSLKTQASVEIAKSAIQKGKTVFYLDTEGKVGLKNKKDLGKTYEYLPIWESILTKIKDLPKFDLLIIDSVGLPISAKYPTFKLNEQGDAWNDLMMLVGDYLKDWAYKNKALAIITNQPKSTFMKSEEELKRLDPLGDKVHFAPNMILRATKTIIPGHYDKILKKAIPPKSIGTFTSHRSTDFMDDIEIFSIIKNDDEIEIKIPNYVLKRIKNLKE